LPFAHVAGADVFVLQNGGQVEGELINRDESPRKTYVVRIADGGEVTLTVDQVAQAIVQSEAERLYEKYLPKMPETADGNWKMAQWCRRHQLDSLERQHLEQVLQHDPQHELARRRLGYSRIEGEWIKTDELMQQRGYVRHEGRWRTPQEIQSNERIDQQQLQQKQFAKDIRRWRRWLDGRRADQALENLKNIRDPLAAPTLAELLPKENSARIKVLYIEILGRLPGGDATGALVMCALYDGDEEARILSLEQLQHRGDSQAVAAFIKALGSNNNQLVKRAAVGLSYMKDLDAVRPLIAALNTQHKRVVDPNAGQIGAAFGRNGQSGGPALSVGGGPRVVQRTAKNREVLDALVSLTGENFQFDEAQWHRWYVESNTPPVNSLRRSE
jgi:hypothetical protein